MNRKWVYLIAAAVIYNETQRKRKSAPVYYLKNLWKNYNAVTIPPFGIFIKESCRGNTMLLQHELVHWEQYQREGLLNFILGYHKENSQKGYDLNKYEIEARLKSGECKECIVNYTSCVRAGKALTVSNPFFRL